MRSPTILLVGAALALAACGPHRTNQILEARLAESEDGMRVVEHIESGGGAAGWISFQYFIEAPDGQRWKFAQFAHSNGEKAAFAWKASDLIDACVSGSGARGGDNGWHDRVAVVTAHGPRQIKIANRCGPIELY